MTTEGEHAMNANLIEALTTPSPYGADQYYVVSMDEVQQSALILADYGLSPMVRRIEAIRLWARVDGADGAPMDHGVGYVHVTLRHALEGRDDVNLAEAADAYAYAIIAAYYP